MISLHSLFNSLHITEEGCRCLHQYNVQQNSLHGIEPTIPAEFLVVDDTKVDCKETSKAAEHEVVSNVTIEVKDCKS